MPANPRHCNLHGLLLALALVFVVGPADAASLAGRVVTAEDGRPLPFAAVRLEREGITRELLAGAAGTFEARDLEPGLWQVRVTYLGYQPLDRSLDLQPGTVTEVAFELTVAAIPMREIEVLGERNQREAELQTGFVEIDAQTLARIPAFGEADPIRALQLLPGVQAASDLSSGLYVRGGGPDQTLVLLDGVPVYNPTHAFGLFSSFHPDLIEGVMLFKGAYPAQYGGRLGAVLDVRSLEGRRQGTQGRIGVSTIAARASLQGSWGDRPGALGVRRTYLDPLLALLRRSEPSVPSYAFYDLNGRIRIPWANGSTDLRLFTSRDGLGIEADEGTSIDLSWGNLVAGGAHRVLIGEEATFSLAAWYSRYRSDTELSIFTTPIDFANRIEDLSAEVRLSFALPPRHRVALGAALSRYDFSFAQSFNLDEQIDFGAKAYDASLFAEDTWSAWTGGTLRLGLRSRYLSDGERVRLEPRLSVRQEIGDRWVGRLGGGIYHQVLQLVSTEGFSGTDFYLPIDETARPSRSWQVVAGLEFTPRRSWRTTVEAYYTGLEDLVVLDNRVSADQSETTAEDVFVTGGTGWASGVELFVERRAGPLTGWIGYTLGWTRRTFDELNGGRAFAPKYDRRHDFSFVTRWQRTKWEFGATWVYGTGQAFTPASARYGVRDPATGEQLEFGDLLAAERNSARLLPYHRLDVSATRTATVFGRPARWSVQVFNLYSRRNDWFVTFDLEDPGAAPEIFRQLPIVPSLGLEIDF
jgi:hypothetical protein